MAKNVSKLFGIPATKAGGIEQFYLLKTKLQNNDVWSIPSMHRGYLVLKHENRPMYKERPHGMRVDMWVNYLTKTKPTGKYLKMVKV